MICYHLFLIHYLEIHVNVEGQTCVPEWSWKIMHQISKIETTNKTQIILKSC